MTTQRNLPLHEISSLLHRIEINQKCTKYLSKLVKNLSTNNFFDRWNETGLDFVFLKIIEAYSFSFIFQRWKRICQSSHRGLFFGSDADRPLTRPDASELRSESSTLEYTSPFSCLWSKIVYKISSFANKLWTFINLKIEVVVESPHATIFSLIQPNNLSLIKRHLTMFAPLKTFLGFKLFPGRFFCYCFINAFVYMKPRSNQSGWNSNFLFIPCFNFGFFVSSLLILINSRWFTIFF